MVEKIISALLWAILWGLIVFLYMNINTVSSNNILSNWNMPVRWTWATFDVSKMSDDQLEKMATRVWITKEELKIKLESWEDIRNLIWTPSWWFNKWVTNTWSWTIWQ